MLAWSAHTSTLITSNGGNACLGDRNVRRRGSRAPRTLSSMVCPWSSMRIRGAMLILKTLAENLGEKQPRPGGDAAVLPGGTFQPLYSPGFQGWQGRPPLLVQLRKAPVTITGYEQLSTPKTIGSFKVFP